MEYFCNMENPLELWEKLYSEKNCVWLKEEYDKHLVSNFELMVNCSREGETKKQLKFFVPLCGTTKDLEFLLEKGHNVFGVEGVPKAIEILNKNHGFELKLESTENDTPVYLSKNGKLRIFNGDFRKCPIEKWGPFDCIWDRASFGSIDPWQRKDYMEMIRKSVMAKDGSKYVDFKCLLSTFSYENVVREGPPYSISQSIMEEHWCSWASVQRLEEKKVEKNIEIFPKTNTKNTDTLSKEFSEVLHLITTK